LYLGNESPIELRSLVQKSFSILFVLGRISKTFLSDFGSRPSNPGTMEAIEKLTSLHLPTHSVDQMVIMTQPWNELDA